MLARTQQYVQTPVVRATIAKDGDGLRLFCCSVEPIRHESGFHGLPTGSQWVGRSES